MRLLTKLIDFEERNANSFYWSIGLAAISGFAAVFSFLIHVVAVRQLSLNQYGELATAIAVVGVIGVGASAIQANVVDDVRREIDLIEIRNKSQRVSTLEISILTLASFGVVLAGFSILHVSLLTAGLMSIWIPVSILLARANGEMQARHLQFLMHGSTLFTTALTLGVSSLTLLLSGGVAGLLAVRVFIAGGFALIVLRYSKTSLGTSFRFFHPNLISATLVFTSVWFLANFDVVISRASLSSSDSGNIAIAAMFVNSVLLFPQLIGAVVYPRIVQNLTRKKQLSQLLTKSLVLAFAVQIILIPVLWGISEVAVRWVAGDNHVAASDAMLLLSLAYVPIGCAIVLGQFLVALGTRTHSIVVLLQVLLGAVLLRYVNASINLFLMTLIFVALSIAASMLVVAKKLIGDSDE